MIPRNRAVTMKTKASTKDGREKIEEEPGFLMTYTKSIPKLLASGSGVP